MAENKYYKDKYKVILIGASLANMSCAIELANNGIDDVLIIEQHNLPGGLATSFVRGGVEFELSLHEMMSIGKNHSLEIGKFLKKNDIDLKWLRVPEAYRLVTDGIDFTLHASDDGSFDIPSKEIAEYDKENKECHKQVMDFFKACLNVHKGLESFTSENKPTALFKYPELVKFAGHTAKEVMDMYSLDKITQDILSAYFVYLGNIPTKLPALLFAELIAQYIGYGSYIPEKYSYSLATSLYEKCLEKGIQIELSQQVKEVLLNDDKATGVILRDGTEIKCERLVSGVYPHILYEKMMKPDADIQKRMNKFVNSKELGLTCFSIYMLLDKSPEELNIKNYCTFFLPEGHDYEKIWDDFKDTNKTPFLICVCLNKANPKYIPQGKTIYSITCLPRTEFFDDVNAANYEEIKHRYARLCIEKESERLNVDLLSHIEEIEIVTPISVSHHTSEPKGSIYGYMHSMDDNVIARVAMKGDDHLIKNLYFTGASSLFGDGMATAMSSGLSAAKDIFSESKGKLWM